MNDKLERELKSFDGLWAGGFRQSNVNEFKDVNKIFGICIKPYINANVDVLEIGCGGGFWTNKMLSAKSVTCLDALSAEHNRFWETIKSHLANVKYFQVKDFKCDELKDDSIDYVFSYDCFCHISYSGTREYLKNLYPKLRNGAKSFIMIADQNKYTVEHGRKKMSRRAGFENFDDFVADYDGEPKSGRWYMYGVKRFCDSLKEFGYIVISEDVAINADKLNPIVYFSK